MNEADEALVTQSQQGNREAFEELVRRTARLVFSRIFLETGDAHRTEDLVQETFLSAWRRIGQVTDRKGFRPWLLSVAHSVTIDSLRHDLRKKRSGSRAKSDVLATLATPDPTPPEVAEREESRQKVLAALRSLPEEYRLPLMLRYIGGADYQSIGRQLNLSNGSLRGMLSRGLALLRSKLMDSGMIDVRVREASHD